MGPKSLNMKLDKPWLFAEDLEMCQMILEDILDRVEQEYNAKRTLDDLMARAKQRNEILKILKIDKPEHVIIEEEEERLKENIETKPLNMKLDKPWLFVGDLEICQMIFEDILDRVDQEHNTKKTSNDLIVRANPTHTTVKDEKSRELECNDIIEKEEKMQGIIHPACHIKAENKEEYQQRNELFKILKINKPEHVMVEEEDKRLQVIKEVDPLYMKLDNSWLFVKDLEMCQMIFEDILDRVKHEHNIKKTSNDLVVRAKQRNEMSNILKFDEPAHVMLEEEEMLQPTYTILKDENSTELECNDTIEKEEKMQRIIHQACHIKAENKEEYQQRNELFNILKINKPGNVVAEEKDKRLQVNREVEPLNIKLDKPCLFVEDLEMCQMIFEDILDRVEQEHNIKKSSNDLMQRNEMSNILKFDEPVHAMLEEEEMLQIVFLPNQTTLRDEKSTELEYNDIIKNEEKLQRIIHQACHIKAENKEEYQENIENKVPQRKIDKPWLLSEDLDMCQERNEISKILKFDKPWHVEDEEMVQGIINNLMERVEEEVERKRMKTLMAKVLEELNSRVTIIHFEENPNNMKSCPLKFNDEKVQKNIKPCHIGSDREEFCQSIHAEFKKRIEREVEIGKVKSVMAEVYQELKLKVPVVLSVSNPLEDAHHANLKEYIETKQGKKCHISKKNDKVPRRKYFKNLKKRFRRLFHCGVSPSSENEI